MLCEFVLSTTSYITFSRWSFFTVFIVPVCHSRFCTVAVPSFVLRTVVILQSFWRAAGLHVVSILAAVLSDVMWPALSFYYFSCAYFLFHARSCCVAFCSIACSFNSVFRSFLLLSFGLETSWLCLILYHATFCCIAFFRVMECCRAFFRIVDRLILSHIRFCWVFGSYIRSSAFRQWVFRLCCLLWHCAIRLGRSSGFASMVRGRSKHWLIYYLCRRLLYLARLRWFWMAHFWDINLLYQEVANRSVAAIVTGERPIYMYYSAFSGWVALWMFSLLLSL